MKTFLEYVAEDIIQKYGTNLSRTAVVFPNKRAALFLNEHLVRLAGKPIWSPAYITISELFRRHTQLITGDQIKLICDLYKTYIEVTESDETLDHFYGWGQVMLADFDDIDKNMADASKVFCNLRDLHELDDVSYLTPEQVETLKIFFSNFSEDKTTELKQRFMKMWSRFHDIYRLYNERLEAQGIAYEGALYRKVVTDENVEFDFDRYIFVGFNVLQRVEQLLFSKLQKMGKAKFYWDFDDYYLATKTGHVNPSEAGHYIKQYLPYFTNELDTSDADIYRNFRKAKKITYASATTEDVLADMLELGEISEDAHRRVGKWAVEYGVDYVLTYGKDAAFISDEVAKLGGKTFHCSSRQEAADNLRFMADAGDIILLKGSNSMQVGKMLEMFK